MSVRALLLVLTAALAVVAPGHAQERPSVVSLDYCADQFVLGLAAREQILAVSTDAEADFSALREQADGLAQIQSTAEDVLALAPDLVVRSYGADQRALALFERAGIEVVQIGYASDFEAIERVIENVAAALGRDEAGRARIDRMRATLASIETGSDRPLALYITPGGATAGAGTLMDAVLDAAGLENAAGDRQGWQSLPMEALMLDSPELIVTGFFDTRATRLDHWSAARHPVLRAAFEAVPTVHLPGPLLSCGTWMLADAALSAHEQYRGREAPHGAGLASGARQ